MDDNEWSAARFEAHRTHLRAVAYRILGSVSEAEDAVQEAWLRLSRCDTSGVADQSQPLAVRGFTIAQGKIVEIDVLADPARLRRLDLPCLDN